MSDYYDLGTHSFAITTSSKEAQTWFDRGLMWCYGFNHGEAVACFHRALKADPDCAMAHWGIAFALGPNYNKAWEAFDDVELNEALSGARQATERAMSLVAGVGDKEAALIRALPSRYPTSIPTEDTAPWIEEFANRMYDVWRNYSDDPDIATLAADALMNRTPWEMWDLKTGEIAEGARTADAVEILELAMERIESTGAPRHAGLFHMYIHLMEMSPQPQKAQVAADRLRDLVPGSGHLQHMPTHIDVLCGHYQMVVDSNQAAIIADTKFLEREGALNFYSNYRVHNYHFKIYGAMFLGQSKVAIETADQMIATLPEELLRIESPPMADWLEGFVPMKQHVLIRFGRWRDIIDQKMPDDPVLYCVTTAMMHYAKSVAHAASGDVPSGEAEAALFDEALKRVPDTRYVFNNSCLDILAVAREMMLGELEYRRGNFDRAFERLRKSVELDDNLPYDEPWGWMQPTRHALAALLLEQNRIDEAAAVYRADLGLDAALSRACQHPDNVWSLHGYHECLRRLGRDDEAALVKQRLDLAVARADVPVKSSCFCRLQQVA
jgi:tetratricopeptide (TPR) repeat protein